MHNYNMSNMSGMQKNAADKLLYKEIIYAHAAEKKYAYAYERMQ